MRQICLLLTALLLAAAPVQAQVTVDLQALDRFEPVDGDIRRWRRPMLLGEPQAVAQLGKAFPNGA